LRLARRIQHSDRTFGSRSRHHRHLILLKIIKHDATRSRRHTAALLLPKIPNFLLLHLLVEHEHRFPITLWHHSGIF
jgi:hypothetical protein